MGKKKVIAWIAGGVLVGGGIFLLTRALKKAKVDKSGSTIIPNTNTQEPNIPVNPSVPSAVGSTDEFPLVIGSSGTNVLNLQKAINKLIPKSSIDGKPVAPLLVEDGVFGQKTYTALVTWVGANYWSINGVTIQAYTEVIKKANNLGKTASNEGGILSWLKWV